MTQNRKRGRNVHEDEMEFMPLSKRINNLHINNTLLLSNANTEASTSRSNIEWGPGPPYLQNNVNANIPTPPESVQSLDWNNSIPQYSPSLSESENPYYFNINRILFEVYWERQQRIANPM